MSRGQSGMPGVGDGNGTATVMAARDGWGVVEYFRPGEHERVERVLAELGSLGIRRLRTGISWADCYSEGGRAWYDWLLPRLGRNVELLPCFAYTPPSLGVVAKTSAPPRDLKAYADFLDVMVTCHGRHFEWVELWNEPNNINDWDWRLDPDWLQFCTMVGAAAYWMKHRGWKTVLGGMCPTDPHWLGMMCERDVMNHIDAVGVHGFPGTWDPQWSGWTPLIAQVRETLHRRGHDPRIWITEAGYSTWNHDEAGQVAAFAAASQADAERLYWYSFQDLHPDLDSQEGFHFDERHYHAGIIEAGGRRKLLHRALAAANAADDEAVPPLVRFTTAAKTRPFRPAALITGGAGFIGANLADRLAASGQNVIIFDALARDHVEENVDWLTRRHGSKIAVEVADIRDFYALRETVRHATSVYHLAAQVAVTTSVDDPNTDFDVNARGTLNVLEALRARPTPPPLLFTSTNKVYGRIAEGTDLEERETRYSPTGESAATGFAEDRPLDFCSPYGCSKGAADQYVQDYARVFDIPTVVFRMSCIYGPRQFGNEDQGWVAHFVRSALERRPITIYGDGKQVRDILFVDDLVAALVQAQARIGDLAGQVFNIGGGPANAVSLLELIVAIEDLLGVTIEGSFRPFRPGDQLYYVSDIRRFAATTGWRPRVGIADGLRGLAGWLDHRFGGRVAPDSSNGPPVKTRGALSPELMA